MSTPQKIQPSFDVEISISDIIHFFKAHKKFILICVILGGILGGLFGNITGPIYEGSVLVSPAKVAGDFLVNPNITLTKLNTNSYYSKETLLICNPEFYKDKEIEYDMSNVVKASITKDNELIELRMNQKNKAIIKECFDNIINDIRQSQIQIGESIIASKKSELSLVEEKLKISEAFKERLYNRHFKKLESKEQNFSADLLYGIILQNSSDINQLIYQLNKIKLELSPKQTKETDKVLPINIKKKSFPSLKLGALLGLFLGLGLGIFISLIKQIKI